MNMTTTPTNAAGARGEILRTMAEQGPCQGEKPSKMKGFLNPRPAKTPAIDAAVGKFFRPRRHPVLGVG
jgi:hypothetical protein